MNFTKITTIIIIITSILVGVFALLGENKAPRVKGEIEIKGSKDSAESIDQNLVINFTSPMNQKSVEESLKITPEVKYDIYWSDNRAFIYFRENLIYDSTYTIEIEDSAKDVYGNKLSKTFKYEFKTKERLLAIQQRGSEDSIIYTNQNFENPKVQFKGPDIKYYDATEKFLAVVQTPKNSVSTLKVKNLENEIIKEIPVEHSIINSIDLSFKNDLLIYIEQPAEKLSGYVIPGETTNLKIYDIKKEKLSTLELPDYITYVLSAELNPDGKSLLIKGPESTYYIVDIFKSTENPISLGTHLSASGFTRNFSELVLVDAPFSVPNADFPVILTLNNRNEQTRITNGDIYSIDPFHYFNKNSLVFSEQTDGPEGKFKIVEYNKDSKEKKILIEFEHEDVELPKISFDDKYIVIERYSDEDLEEFEGLRNIGFLSKPYNATVLVYDIKSGKLLGKELRAVNAIWIE